MALTVIFVRHGESTANVQRIFANRPEIPGHLTPDGIAQAEALASTLAGAGLTYIYTSPLPRAAQTAAIIARHVALPVETADALREYDVGEDEGFPYTGDDAWRWERYEAVQRAWRDGDRLASHTGGESLDDIERRMRAFLKAIAARHGERDVILAVGHGGTFHAALPRIFPTLPKDIDRTSPLGHTDQVVARHERRWRCVRWAGLDLPDDAGEPGR